MISNVIWMMISHILSRGSFIFSGMLIARYLDKADFASYSYLLLTATMIAIYSAMGIGITTTKFYANIDSKETESPVATLALVSCVLSILVVLIFFIFNQIFIPSNVDIPILVMAIIIFSMSLDIYTGSALIGLEKFKQLAFVSIFSTIINMITVIFSIYNKNVYISMVGLAVASTLQVIFNSSLVIYNLKVYKFYSLLKVKWHHLIRIFHAIGPMLFVSIIAASGTWIIGRLIISENSEKAISEFSLFSIGLQWYSIALFLPTMISKVILPQLIKRPNSSSNKLLKFNMLIVSISCLLFAIFGFFAEPMIALFYGSEFKIPRGLIFAYLFAAVVASPANIIGNALIARNKEKEWLLIVICSFGTILLIGILGVHYGAWMGAAALIASSLVLVLISIYYLEHNKKII